MGNVKVTIVIATFNASKTLRKALDSILNQSFNDWECLVIDGFSSDDTMEIVKEYEKRDSRIRSISEPDNGIYDAFNKGWRNAKSDWIYYLGADDELLSSGLKELAAVVDIVDEDVAIVSGGVLRIRQDGTKKVIMSNGFTGSHQSMLTRRKVLEKLGGFDLGYKILADFDSFIRIKNAGYGVINKPVVVAKFAAGGTSEAPKYTKQIFMEKYSILKNDKLCTSPLFKTLYDTSRTLLGACLHKVK